MPDRAIVRAEGAQCHSADNAVGFRIDDAQPGLGCHPDATLMEMHEAMVRGVVGILEDVPGPAPASEAARDRSEQRAITEEDVRLGLVIERVDNRAQARAGGQGQIRDYGAQGCEGVSVRSTIAMERSETPVHATAARHAHREGGRHVGHRTEL